MRHLDLFSGIGGFALAARRVGWETIGFCEIDPYCQKVLKKHWPGVPIYDDIKTVTAYSAGFGCGQRRAWGITTDCENGIPTKAGISEPVDIITAGFPCQDISHAGKQAGIEGERSGLWSELARIIGEVRPRYAVLENVSALLSGDRGRWFQRVLGDLAEIGYDCEWHCIPASAIGAPHQRDRVWVIAYPSHNGCGIRPDSQREGTTDKQRRDDDLRGKSVRPGTSFNDVADTECVGRGQVVKPIFARKASEGLASTAEYGCKPGGWQGWTTEPNVGRVANGIPRRVDRLRALGNSIVPQVAEVIFNAINQFDKERKGVNQ